MTVAIRPAAAALVAALGCGAAQGGADGGAADAAVRDAADAGDAADAPDARLPGRCIGEWPAAPEPRVVPALRVEPGIAWVRRLPGRTVGGAPVVTADRVALNTGGGLALLDHDGNVLREPAPAPCPPHGSCPRPLGLTADGAGNLYVGSSSYDAGGAFRWSYPNDDPSPRQQTAALVGPHGLVYFGTSDGRIHAARTADGSRAWVRRVGPGPRGSIAAPLLGAGDTLAVAVVGRVLLLDARTGEAFEGWAWEGESPIWPRLAGYGTGLVGTRPVAAARWYAWYSQVFDRCGGPAWQFPADGSDHWAQLIGPGDELLVIEAAEEDLAREEPPPRSLSVWGPDGRRRRGPVRIDASLWAVGADGTIYAAAWSGDPHEPFYTLLALAPDLTERWRVEIGIGLVHGAALADDGLLFCARDAEGDRIEVIAIRTPSPGLARSAWPALDRDARGRRWLAE